MYRDHWSRVGIETESEECRYCKATRETAEHIVMECPAVWRHDATTRDDLLNTFGRVTGEPATLQMILNYRDGPIFDALERTVDELVKRGVVL